MRDESVRQKERAREKQEGAQHDYSVHRENLSCAALQTRQAISQAEPAMQALTCKLEVKAKADRDWIERKLASFSGRGSSERIFGVLVHLYM